MIVNLQTESRCFLLTVGIFYFYALDSFPEIQDIDSDLNIIISFFLLSFFSIHGNVKFSPLHLLDLLVSCQYKLEGNIQRSKLHARH